MDELYLKKLQEMEEARQQGLRQMDEAQRLGLKNIEEQAYKSEALQKIANPNFEQVVGSPGSGQTFTRRTYGPYQLDTSLESADTKDGVARDKSGALRQSLRYLGGGHSEEDAKKIAKELQEIGKPVDVARWQKTLSELQPSKKTDNGYEGDEYILGKTVSRTDKGQNAKPLWYEEDEEEEK